jgi:hypothetical protein
MTCPSTHLLPRRTMTLRGVPGRRPADDRRRPRETPDDRWAGDQVEDPLFDLGTRNGFGDRMARRGRVDPPGDDRPGADERTPRGW